MFRGNYVEYSFCAWNDHVNCYISCVLKLGARNKNSHGKKIEQGGGWDLSLLATVSASGFNSHFSITIPAKKFFPA